MLKLSQKNLRAKINNQMHLAQRPELFREEDIRKCTSVQMQLGVEGTYASVYFTELSKMLPAQYHFIGRKKHPATDPVNSVLSFVYTLLYNKMAGVLAVRGLNPSVGFCHSLRNGHYALSSDLMESLRCELCDTLVLELFQKEPDMQHFTKTPAGIRISKELKQQLIREFHDRLLEANTTLDGFSNSNEGIIEQIVCSYVAAIAQGEAELFTPYEMR